MSVLFYGLLPRTILLMTGFFGQRRQLSRIGFNHAACERLLHRMRTPVVRTGGSSEDVGLYNTHDMKAEKEGDYPATLKAGIPTRERGLIVLVPDEIFDDCKDDDLENILSLSLGYSIRKKLRFGGDENEDQKVIEEILRMHQEHGPGSVMILKEAWQPLIREDMQFLRDLRNSLGKKSIVKIGLIGRPDADSIFTPVKEEDWEAWKRKLKIMGDPYIDLERVVRHDA